jgi:hypothetical protein
MYANAYIFFSYYIVSNVCDVSPKKSHILCWPTSKPTIENYLLKNPKVISHIWSVEQILRFTKSFALTKTARGCTRITRKQPTIGIKITTKPSYGKSAFVIRFTKVSLEQIKRICVRVFTTIQSAMRIIGTNTEERLEAIVSL